MGNDGRGVVYVAWGLSDPKVRDALARSQASLNAIHPELPMTVRELPHGSTLNDKARMYELSPYEHTLYLDVDTQVLSRLDYGFQKAVRHGIACAICEAPYARRYYKAIQGDVIEYNTGVLFFSRSDAVAGVFRRWGELARSIDSVSKYFGQGAWHEMPVNDQAGFAMAVEESGISPFVLPPNWNFRFRFMAMAYGPIKVWHDWSPVPPPLAAKWKQQEETGLMNFVELSPPPSAPPVQPASGPQMFVLQMPTKTKPHN